MKAEQYIVVRGEDVKSTHRFLTEAWEAADRIHFGLGGKDNDKMLAQVFERCCRVRPDSKRGRALRENVTSCETFIHAGWMYEEVTNMEMQQLHPRS